MNQYPSLLESHVLHVIIASSIEDSLESPVFQNFLGSAGSSSTTAIQNHGRILVDIISVKIQVIGSGGAGRLHPWVSLYFNLTGGSNFVHSSDVQEDGGLVVEALADVFLVGKAQGGHSFFVAHVE